MKRIASALLLFTLLLMSGSTTRPASAQEFAEPAPPEGMPLPPIVTEPREISVSQSMDSGPDLPPVERESVSFTGKRHVYEADGMDDTTGDTGDTSNGSQKYTVKRGDTLGSISRKFFGSSKYWKKIANANGISNPSNLKVGRQITIPGSGNSGSVSVSQNRRRAISSPDPVESLPPVVAALPPVSYPGNGGTDTILYQDKGLPKIILPESGHKDDSSHNNVTFDGLTGLVHTFAAYPLGKGLFSTAFGVVWNKITKREGTRLVAGEDGDYFQFPIALTYAGENFETALVLPFESYNIYAPKTYNFRDGNDSGMGNAALRLKFSSQNENMASCLGLGALFPTSDRKIGKGTNDNAWEVFGGVSTKHKEGGNFHLNGGYQATSGNTTNEGVFFNVGFEYAANTSFTFMGEINNYNAVTLGRSTDLTLSLRYFVKPGMTITVAAPIALANEQFFGYDYRLQAQLQYHY
ncbi:MAG: LysM peptidoglycan-binding domain-containing protein [Candidatus Riflebacteria bacterium]|nr:LysM peptidoglycan-binding domain-containing protein [Candidatus Riflebacteria bacterium]